MHYYLAELEYYTDPDDGDSWAPPLRADALSFVDLRGTPSQAATSGSGFGVVAYSTAKSDSRLTLLGTALDETVSEATKRLVESALGAPTIESTSVLDMLWDLLGVYSDPDGLVRAKPILPTSRSVRELHLQNHSIVRSERFRSTGNYWPAVQRVVQEDYRRMRQDVLDGLATRNLHRKWLELQRRKYRVDARQLVPANLPFEPPLPPSTTLTESFNTGDSDTLGPDQTWTEVVNDFDIVSNQCSYRTDDGSHGRARAEADLSGDDHTCQVDVVTLTELGTTAAAVAGPATRYSNSADTCYTHQINNRGSNSDQCQTAKIVAGTRTLLGTPPTITISIPDTVKGECNGSTIKSFVNGTEEESITDTAISGNTRCGLAARLHAQHAPGDAEFDTWQAQDLAAGGTTNPFSMGAVNLLRGKLQGA